MATKKPAKKGFTAEEREAMQEHVKELRSKDNGESEVLAKIAQMAASAIAPWPSGFTRW